MKRIIVTRDPYVVDYMVELENGSEGPGYAFLYSFAQENPDELRSLLLELAHRNACTHIFDPLVGEDLTIEQYTAPITVDA